MPTRTHDLPVTRGVDTTLRMEEVAKPQPRRHGVPAAPKRGRFAGVIIVAVLIAVSSCSGRLAGDVSTAEAGPLPTTLLQGEQDGSGPESEVAPLHTTVVADTPSGAGCTPNLVAQICATVQVTGGSTVSGTAGTDVPLPPSADPASTCGELATAPDGGTLGAQLTSVDGHSVSWDTSVADFHGPGHYSGIEFTLTIDDNVYYPAGAGDVAITIGPDFAVTMTFNALTSGATGAGPVSGQIQWTCLNPS